ncbi:MAG: hypothetical protein IPI31_13805 [Bacteroidetes bacterium]|jgi:hypothetical protein|nr:hypothetical protein [Bacteroidota bacterium]MBP9795466.1 hypothetical protein [Chitinophagales bacterium]
MHIKSIYLLLIIFPFLQCANLESDNSPTIKYFGTLVEYDSKVDKNKYTDFEISDLKKIHELDSILDFTGTSVSSGERFYTIVRVDLYRALKNTDTLCYMIGITNDNFALTQRYSNCETGFLRKTSISILLGEYLIKYFKEKAIYMNNN